MFCNRLELIHDRLQVAELASIARLGVLNWRNSSYLGINGWQWDTQHTKEIPNAKVKHHFNLIVLGHRDRD